MIQRSYRKTIAASVFAACIAFALPAGANQLNERTVLEFSAPVKVPGTTLQPGTYVFRLADLESDRHLVHIMNEDGTRLVATVSAIPAKRDEAIGDTVLKFNPTASGTPAIKAWFYPGTVFGHEFVYSDAEAKDIAKRTKTVVLSSDVVGSDKEQGALHVYDAEGLRKPWSGDKATSAAWNKWHEARATAGVAQAGAEADKSRAPMVAADQRGTKVEVEDLEERSGQYIGKVVSVDAVVEKVLGPRMFTIDEPRWGDLDGEVMVYMPTELVALVREGDRVTVTGTPKAYVRGDMEREWGWFEPNPDIEVELNERAVLLANRIVGGNNELALVIKAGSAPGTSEPKPVGTSGSTDTPAAESAVSDLKTIESGDDDIVGRRVTLTQVPVSGTAKERGFWIRGPEGTSVFVLPGDRSAASSSGQVTLEGVVLQMPNSMKDRLNPGVDWNDDVYIYATKVTR